MILLSFKLLENYQKIVYFCIQIISVNEGLVLKRKLWTEVDFKNKEDPNLQINLHHRVDVNRFLSYVFSNLFSLHILVSLEETFIQDMCWLLSCKVAKP